MILPTFDFELAYWRLRRRTQRIRSAWRAHCSHARADAHLRFLYYFGRLPNAPEPEETFLYRALWAVVIVSFAGVLVLEAVGQEQLLAALKHLLI